jgi:hypothetical protein
MLCGSRAFQAKFIGHFSPTQFHLWLIGSLGRRLVVKVGTSKGSTISHMAADIRGISYREPYRKKKKKLTFAFRDNANTPKKKRHN